MLRAMTEKLNKLAIYRWYVGIMVSIMTAMIGIGVYFAKQINDKVEYSFKANVEQQIKNEEFKNNAAKYEEAILIIDSRMDKISERFYSLEAIVKYSDYNKQQDKIN